MRLYIAEKPSLGRAIAAALPGPVQKGPGWLRCGEGDQGVVVSWCIGHLLEPAEPASYHARWKSWRMEDLPVFPEQWQLTPKESVAKQLGVLSSLIRKAEIIIHAGDPDREGQLLVDEVIRYAGARCPVERVLINDLTPDAVARALAAPRDNREFRRLSHSALARQRADWLYGINLTRYYTLSYRQQGADGVYSVGRVQTPVLGLVVHRDDTIADFEARPWYRVTITAQAAEGENPSPFQARWMPSESQLDQLDNDHLDEENRLISRTVADEIANGVTGRPGRITQSRFRDRDEAPPLPLSLSALQIEAGKVFRMGAKDVLDTAQSLYEKHQLITYPRSDSRYLPEGHLAQAPGVVRAIGQVDGSLADTAGNLDLQRRSAAWNDAKVDAHHAIIPTLRSRPAGRLSQGEENVYNLIARYYLMQFMASAIHREGRLDLTIAGHDFRATETAVLEPGWKALEPRQRENNGGTTPRAPLPRLEKGDDVTCTDASVKERLTQPPSHFTDATLLSAMTNIARFVADPELRKTLRDTDGLGTEATRAAIIETLFRRDYLYREGRFIRATEKGRDLIHALPESISQPDMTALWEATLEQIRAGEGDPRAFIDQLKDQIVGFIRRPTSSPRHPAPTGEADSGSVHCPKCRAPMRIREGKFGRFHACSRFPDCKGTRPIEEVAPEDGTSQKPWPCPACYAPLVRRKSHRGWFWGCSNFPSCRQTVNDDSGTPAALTR
ncbi:DNA topoisomerase-3 [Marinobacter daqiaonensis]|uniref:DNA topoisomerase n=1 Tax=Marinobacter daqiaonensis TaxID=650891 RepID=A0A1I6JFV2_9GAMM|nr:DNA topoisomerase III [Marinobacter daqiaonensis]SFR77739.1 DNA topoisomerase-3 [Marinobacter daqiaonensis]